MALKQLDDCRKQADLLHISHYKQKWLRWITDPTVKARPVGPARDNVHDPELSKDFTPET